jgi:hypothetical protein
MAENPETGKPVADRHQTIVLEAVQALQFRSERVGKADAVRGFEFVEAHLPGSHQLRERGLLVSIERTWTTARTIA